ncbi:MULTISPECIES: response regulator [unclassified Pseudomonas]|uniref:response regulator n=1 Tax=unclassified Pseudomonas TaxID=196821 RepID=UPI00244727AD|nr:MULTISPECIES: response regulator [unclassified Pseudomonas]MDH0895035.1 response regulator [Pseudomonas sp. GD03875]MDH1065414.1 response regulator [Pseudomonas sp. GD03985]
MTTLSLLVCDDSAMARKQLLRALPPEWPVDVCQAAHGQEAMERIRQGGIDLLLLDLTMPVLDGYGVLTALRDEGLECRVIVVSGDVQEEAIRRVTELGALAFLKKPADPALVRETLQRLGLFDEVATAEPTSAPAPAASEPEVNFRDAFREVINVAMGRAAALLARVLGVFVQLPLPNVNILEVGELHMALADAQSDERLTAVCQGYIGGGIAGEALLIFHDSEVEHMARLLHREAVEASSMEMLLDMGSVLIGACLSGIAEQINIRFSQGHPQILGQHAPIDELIRLNQQRWRKTLAVEFSYSIEGHDIHFDLMLLFTEDSVPLLTKKLAYMMG